MTELPRSPLTGGLSLALFLILGRSWVEGGAPPPTKLFLTRLDQSQILANRLGFWGTSPLLKAGECPLPI